jgi:hypothetical protein
MRIMPPAWLDPRRPVADRPSNTARNVHNRRMIATRAPALLLALGLALAGCGADEPAGTTGSTPAASVASPEPSGTVDVDEVVGGVMFAYLGAKTVHLKGTIGDSTIDLRQRKGGDTAGSVLVGDQKGLITKIGSELWLSGNGPFLEEVAGEGASDVLRGKWFKAPDSLDLASFAIFTDRAELARAFLSADYIKGEMAELRGEPAVRLTAAKGGVLWVTPGDRNLPLRLEGGADIALDFLDYDADVKIQPPPASKVIEAP